MQYIMCITACMQYIVCITGTHQGQKRPLDSLELELYLVVSWHVGFGNQIHILYKTSNYA